MWTVICVASVDQELLMASRTVPAAASDEGAAREALYAERLGRYVTAMRNEKPDMVPIRPFVAEFTGRYAGYTCQEVTHDYEKAFAAARQCAADFDWDAVVGNMVYVWTGLTQAIGLKYYAVPGIDLPARPRRFSTSNRPRTRRGHAGRRVRPADRGPDRLSCSTCGCRGCRPT